MTAESRAMELMQLPMSKLPPLAHEFARYLCRKVGGCGEVFITAFAAYAQCVEGLQYEDELYKVREEDIAWFKEREGKSHD